MSETIREAIADDGSKYPFVDKGSPAARGGMKDIYFAPDKTYAVAFFRTTPQDKGLERLEKIVGKYRRAIFEENPDEGKFWEKLFCWPQKIVTWDDKTGYVMPFYPKNFFFSEGRMANKEKNSRWFLEGAHFNRVLTDVKRTGGQEQSALKNYLHVCWKLACAIRRLHQAGMAHSDISYNNYLVSPKDYQAYLIDLDGLVIPDEYKPDVAGSPDFTAPEVLKTRSLPLDDPNRQLPSHKTDRHALAVLLYMHLFHRHPLKGDQFFSANPDEQVAIQMSSGALFVEHPTDDRNRVRFPAEHAQPWSDPATIPYETAGPELAALFRQAFVDGLHDPDKRPSAAQWEKALFHAFDLCLPCSGQHCPKKGFIFDPSSNAKPTCPYCGTPYVYQIPIFEFYTTPAGLNNYRPENRRLVVTPMQPLYVWHAQRYLEPNEKLPDDQFAPVGYVSFHKGRWVLVNQTLPHMRNLSDGQDVPPNSSLQLRDGLELLLHPGAEGRKVVVRMIS